jgi:hypothetical protein
MCAALDALEQPGESDQGFEPVAQGGEIGRGHGDRGIGSALAP